MLTFEFLPARHGDCALVRWGDPERVMLVDGGPEGVYEEVLRPRLMHLPHPKGQSPSVDVLCLSHVDDDHVVGVIRLLKELHRAKKDQLPLPINLRRVWFNSVDDVIERARPGLAASVRALAKSVPPNTAMSASYGQGQDVRSSISALSLSGNVPFGGPLLQGSTTRLHDLQVNVLGPSVAAMAELAEQWRASVAAKNLKAIAAAYADRSVPNLSSIALHLGFEGRSGLLTGDARGDHLLTGLEAVALLVPGKTIHVDVLKLPHHGSEYNAGRSMFERVRADHYVVCADGIKHDHPSKATLEWLVSSRAVEDTYTIHLTNPIPAAEAILKELGVGRSFKVAVGRPYVRIVLTDMAKC